MLCFRLTVTFVLGITWLMMSLDKLSDELLITECRKGNIKAFDQLFSRYFQKLCKYAAHHTNNPELAEELTMDLMVWLWNKKDVLEVKGDLSAYLFKAIKNAIYNHFRKTALAVDAIDDHLLQAAAAQTAEDNLRRDEIGQCYQMSLAALTPQRRKVFQLSREQDMTYAEIATHLNLSVKTVEAHISASLQLMRKHFKDYVNVLLLIAMLQFLN